MSGMMWRRPIASGPRNSATACANGGAVRAALNQKPDGAGELGIALSNIEKHHTEECRVEVENRESTMKQHQVLKMGILLPILLFASQVSLAGATDKKPNIVIIWGDDIGQTNISAYSKGLMGCLLY